MLKMGKTKFIMQIDSQNPSIIIFGETSLIFQVQRNIYFHYYIKITKIKHEKSLMFLKMIAKFLTFYYYKKELNYNFAHNDKRSIIFN